MPIIKQLMCSHNQIVSTGPYPDTRIWHMDTHDFCTDRPETLRTVDCAVTPVGMKR